MEDLLHVPGPSDGEPSLKDFHVDFRITFAYACAVVGFMMQARKQFVVTCKRCRRDVPSGVEEFPFQSIMVTCPLCGEQHKYLPSEVFMGQQNHLVTKHVRAEAR